MDPLNVASFKETTGDHSCRTGTLGLGSTGKTLVTAARQGPIGLESDDGGSSTSLLLC